MIFYNNKYKFFFKYITKNKIIIILCLIIFLIIYIKQNHQFRVLVYSCCDEFYSHYIPIFCNTLLRSDKLRKIDIEIGVNINKLSTNEEKALEYLRKQYPQSKIKIDYNIFIKNNSGTFYKNYKIWSNSVRFIVQPYIKNKYVYITDIDILIFINNFYLELIDDLKRRKTKYSNIIRMNSQKLTGLHFIEYDSYYPIDSLDYLNNTNINDEILLYNIMKNKKIKLDNVTQYRPVFGIHLSPNRKYVSSYGPIVGWGADNYKFQWIEYIKSRDFKYIYPLLDQTIKDKIKKLNEFYAINKMNVN